MDADVEQQELVRLHLWQCGRRAGLGLLLAEAFLCLLDACYEMVEVGHRFLGVLGQRVDKGDAFGVVFDGMIAVRTCSARGNYGHW